MVDPLITTCTETPYYLPIHPAIYLYIYRYVSIFVSVFLHLCLSDYLSMSPCLFLSVSQCKFSTKFKDLQKVPSRWFIMTQISVANSVLGAVVGWGRERLECAIEGLRVCVCVCERKREREKINLILRSRAQIHTSCRGLFPALLMDFLGH